MCNEDFAKLVSVGCEVHETPDNVEFSFLVTLPTFPGFEFLHHQGYCSGRNDGLRLFQGPRRHVNEDPTRIILHAFSLVFQAFGYLNVLIADFEEVDDFGGESRCDLHALGMVERPLSL